MPNCKEQIVPNKAPKIKNIITLKYTRDFLKKVLLLVFKY